MTLKQWAVGALAAGMAMVLFEMPVLFAADQFQSGADLPPGRRRIRVRRNRRRSSLLQRANTTSPA
jgi:hypothetical protein